MEKKHVYSIDAIVGKFKIDSKLKLDILIKVENNGDNSLSQYGREIIVYLNMDVSILNSMM